MSVPMTQEKPQKVPRIPPLPESQWSGEVRELLAKASSAGEEKPLNIFTTLARHPKLFKRWMVFAAHVLSKSTLPPRERELVILRIGWLCRSHYEFHQHKRIGLACGLSRDEIRRVTAPLPDGWSDRDRALIRATDELHADRTISDQTWSELRETWSEQQLFDLVFTVGQYTLVSMVLNTLGVQTEDGSEGFAS
jgi:4-carboxymuconolactone decarboxylase